MRIPAVWGSGWPWYEMPYRPRVMHVHEVQVFDDIGRRMAASASVRINNRWGDMSGVFGNFSATLTASNGAGWAVQRLRGVLAGSPGLQVSRQDPARYAEGVIHDPSYKLRRPLGQEIILDGWCIYSAVRLLMEIGQIHPDFLVNIPWYPYGPAGYDCPYPILGRGTGLSPRFRFMPDATVMGVLSDLVQDAGCVDPITGVSVPYFWGFDRWGQAHFEPFDPRGLPVATWYTDTDLTGLHRIEEIQVINSIEDLRTEITFQGHDALTNELLNLHVPLPADLATAGFNYPWFERNSRWSSEEYVGRLMGSAVNAASLPGQLVRMLVPFDPNVFAGQLVGVRERQALGGSGLFVITSLESRYGLMDATGRHGEQECHSIVTARAAESLMPA
ncbi:MAG: hypothetical protein NT029_08310 [Armatimonadetes bacterium]|nr:hypothetical protein [Armatimonadota bacterium]